MILAIVAHGDDEVLGCGGVLVQTEEASSYIVCAEYRDRQQPGHIQAAALTLGAGEYRPYKTYRDQELDHQYPLRLLISEVAGIVRTLEPHTVYTHWSGDLNRDHRIVSEAVSVACRPYASSVNRLLHFEVPSSTEWGLTGFKPNTFVDISETIEKKIEAMNCYETEVRESPHPRSPDSMRARAKYWGQQVGMEYAEPFVLIRDCR